MKATLHECKLTSPKSLKIYDKQLKLQDSNMKLTKSKLKKIIQEEKLKLTNEAWTPADAGAAAAKADARGPDFGYLQRMWTNAANDLLAVSDSASQMGLADSGNYDDTDLYQDMSDLVEKAFKIGEALEDRASAEK